jgi:hypothetical protein
MFVLGSEFSDTASAAPAGVPHEGATADPARNFLLRLPDVLQRVLTPLICGIAVYVLFGAARSAESAPPLTTSHLDQLNLLLQRANIPEAAAVLMQQLVTQTERIQTESLRFSESVGAVTQNLKAFDDAITASRQQCDSLAGRVADLAGDVGRMHTSVTSLHQDVQTTRHDIRECAQAFDEFSKITASRILNFSEPVS